MNKAAVNMCVQVFVVSTCLGKYQGAWLQNFSRKPSNYLQKSLSFSIATSSEREFLLPHIFTCIWYPHCFGFCNSIGVSEKAMAPHSSTLAWKIPWTEESSRLQSMGSLRVVSLSLFPFMYWRRKWQPTPVFLPGESQGRGSLVGCRLWGRTESDTTEAT